MTETYGNAELEAWASKLGPTVVLSFIFLCLVVGKALHAYLKNSRWTSGLVVPPSILSGSFGLILFGIAHNLEENMAISLQGAMQKFQDTLSSFCFVALTLGLYSSGTRLKNARQVFNTILAEGMPMLFYTQILIWGQTALCLGLCVVMSIGREVKVPTMYGVLVPAGLEQGTDLLIDSTTIGASPFITTVLEEAQSLGLICTCITSVLVISLRPWLVSQGYTTQSGSKHLLQGSGNAEAFLRGGGKVSPRPGGTGGLRQNTSAADSLGELVRPGGGDKDDSGTNNTGGMGFPGLGMHLALVALPSFFSFLLVLAYHLMEVKYLSTLSSTFFGVRLFKVSMVIALGALLILHRRGHLCTGSGSEMTSKRGFDSLGFKRDVFLLLCGLFLDLTFIAALSGSWPRAHRITHYYAVGALVFMCLVFNVCCYQWIGRKFFPNYGFERAIVVSAGVTGDAFSGLFMARVLDPTLASPVAAAFASNLMLFFIPGTTAKNKVIVKLLSSYQRGGPLLAFSVSLCVAWVWIVAFQSSAEVATTLPFKSPRPNEDSVALLSSAVNTQTSLSSSSAGEEEEKKKKGSRKDARAIFNASDTTTPSDPSSLSNSQDEEDTDKASTPTATALAAGARAMLSEPSEICSPQLIHMVASWLPSGKRSRKWHLRYSLLRDGASLDTLLWACRRDQGHGHGRGGGGGESGVVVGYILLIEDSRSCKFGAFLSHAVTECSSYNVQHLGSGESFVFRLGTEAEGADARVYRWTGNNDCFYLCNTQQGLCIGGGGAYGGCAISLDDELDGGASTSTETYDNDQLSSSEFFKTLNCELYELTDFV